MKHFKKWRRFPTVVLSLALLLGLTQPIAAAERVDPAASASLTVLDLYNDAPISAENFRLYRVADVTEDLTFTLTADFAQSQVSMETSETQDTWADRAATLESYVVERIAEGDPIPPTASAATDQDGAAEFSDLTPGMYLLVGDQKNQGSAIHKPLATLISLPTQETDETWNYHPTVYAKSANRTRRDETVDLSVVKIWKDEGAEAQRPQSVTVTLYQDETEYDTVTLSPENSWRYTWENLDSMSDWHLAERSVPADYTVTSVEENSTFVVTNTYRAETPAEPTLSPAPSAPTSSTPTTPTTQTKLPQTGQLWWPVTLLSVAGLTLLLTGWGIRRKEKDEHEA
jgi:hypothetical protein